MYLIRHSISLPKKAPKIPNQQASLLSILSSSDPKPENPVDWNRAISDAEKIVGYPTSFLNLRWLLNDEVANVAMHLRKLIGTNHPLLKTAKHLFVDSEKPSWGLIVLLVSKAAGCKGEFSNIDRDMTAGVLHSQRILAEVVEMLRTSHQMHKAVITITSSMENKEDLNFGNKIALLSGDYLLSTSYQQLASIRNPDVNELLSSAVRDQTESEFIGCRDMHNRPLPAKPDPDKEEVHIPDQCDSMPLPIGDCLGNAKAEWTLRNLLGGATLLAKICQGSLKLAGHSEEFQMCGYRFGKHLALARQANRDLEFIYSYNKVYNLVSAPVLFHLQYDPSLYSEIEQLVDSYNDLDYERLCHLVKCGPGPDKTKSLQQEHYQAALEVLENFPSCEAQTALKNILYELK